MSCTPHQLLLPRRYLASLTWNLGARDVEFSWEMAIQTIRGRTDDGVEQWATNSQRLIDIAARHNVQCLYCNLCNGNPGSPPPRFVRARSAQGCQQLHKLLQSITTCSLSGTARRCAGTEIRTCLGLHMLCGFDRDVPGYRPGW